MAKPKRASKRLLAGQAFLPTAELVLYSSRGEYRYALSVFDKQYRAITMEGVLGDDRRRAIRSIGVIADRLGLVRSRDNENTWLRLVPSGEVPDK